MRNEKSAVSSPRVAGSRVSKASALAKKSLERARGLALKGKGDEALVFLREAAGWGSGEADYAIGTWYGFGKHLPQNDEKAIKHFKRAARKKYGPALYNLAYSYETGRGVRKDLARAFGLYVEAARVGDFEAANSVYRCLYHGIGVIRNRALAELVEDLIDGTFTRRRQQVRKDHTGSTK